MNKLLLMLVSLMLLAQTVIGQADDKPTIAILRFGPHATYSLVELALVDALPATGMINAEEQKLLHREHDLEGEHINVIWGRCQF